MRGVCCRCRYRCRCRARFVEFHANCGTYAELAYALLEQEFIRLQDGECHLVRDISHLDYLPNTVEGVIISRLDRLLPSQQLSLKVASVIGRIFASRLLYDIHPVEADKIQLTDDLATLQTLGLTLLLQQNPELAYIFRHIITQEVTYNLIPFGLRRQLHQTIASWYEARYSSDLTPFYPLLAHHWYQALLGEGARGRGGEGGAREGGARGRIGEGARGRIGEGASGRVGERARSPLEVDLLATSKAIDYLEKAGEQALHGYANLEAARFFERLLELDQNIPYPISPLRQAGWRRQLGEAYLRLGKLKESQESLQQAVAILGYSMPSKPNKLLKSLIALTKPCSK